MGYVWEAGKRVALGMHSVREQKVWVWDEVRTRTAYLGKGIAHVREVTQLLASELGEDLTETFLSDVELMRAGGQSAAICFGGCH